MAKFLRENWLLIAIPFALAAALIVILIVMTDGGEESAFIYNIF